MKLSSACKGRSGLPEGRQSPTLTSMDEPGPLALALPDGLPAPIDGKCNAKLRDKMERCNHMAGWDTDHPGAGKCKLHGGNSTSPIKTGNRSTRIRHNLVDAIEAMEQSPELLSLDHEVAVVKTLLDRNVDTIVRADEAYQHWVEQMENMEEGDDPPPPPKMPGLDPELVKLVVSSTKTAYDMRFARKFSIPITEVRDILSQVVATFNDICDQYGLSEEARTDFAMRLRKNIKISTPVEDSQLMRAGQGRATDD